MEPGAWPSADEIEDIARRVARAHQSRLMSYDARFEAAWDGIIQAIADGNEDLAMAARLAINKANMDFYHHYGLARDGGRKNDRHTGRNFHTYWHVTADPWTFADQLTEDMAIRQIWDALPQRHRDTLNVFMDSGWSTAGTASVMGITYANASYRICAARDAAKKMWFEPDIPPPHWHRAVAGEKKTSSRDLAAARRWRQRQKLKEKNDPQADGTEDRGAGSGAEGAA